QRATNCTLKIAVRTESGWHSLIGKVYAADRQDVYQVMERLVRAGFGSDAEASIPQPIAYLPAMRLLLQERVEGTLAKEIFQLGDTRGCAEAAERCARWLTRFQATAPPTGRPSGVENFLKW